MARKTAPIRTIPEDFKLTERTIAWVEANHPSVDIPKTLEKFIRSAEQHGRMYANWQRAFEDWVERAVTNKWDGVFFKKGIDADPRWLPVLELARQYGYPHKPQAHDTPQSFRTRFEQWKTFEKRSPEKPRVVEFGNALKGLAK